ncbi:MAG: hypothetical protein PHC34_12495 [Candidatus Gastranaerophilales bacterium]|nr:hypothetical protein [Candidatus Gastranaerophilales bacterium]
MSIIYDYNSSGEILEQVYSKFPELKEYNIKIIFSDEFMQIHKEFQSNDKVPIDKFFGEYNHECKTIFIYLQGINLFLTNGLKKKNFNYYLR